MHKTIIFMLEVILIVFIGWLLIELPWCTLCHAAEPWQTQETRYCGPPVRDAAGNIKRSTAVLNAFKRAHPCPANGQTSGACPGWAINHTIPLACGGCDSVANLDWMPDQIKSCAADWCRDRWERKVYAADPPFEDTGGCKSSIPIVFGD